MGGLNEHAERSRFLLANAQFMTLATFDGTSPWASTVNFVALYEPLRLLYYSLHTALHSRNTGRNPRVSGSIYMTGLPGFGLDGAQFTGDCHDVGPQALALQQRPSEDPLDHLSKLTSLRTVPTTDIAIYADKAGNKVSGTCVKTREAVLRHPVSFPT